MVVAAVVVVAADVAMDETVVAAVVVLIEEVPAETVEAVLLEVGFAEELSELSSPLPLRRRTSRTAIAATAIITEITAIIIGALLPLFCGCWN